MHMLRYGKGTFLATVMAGLLTLSLITAGCGSRTQTKSAAVSVKAMKVLQQDTAVSTIIRGRLNRPMPLLSSLAFPGKSWRNTSRLAPPSKRASLV